MLNSWFRRKETRLSPERGMTVKSLILEIKSFLTYGTKHKTSVPRQQHLPSTQRGMKLNSDINYKNIA